MGIRSIVSPRQIVADEVGHRGRKLFPGFYWVGFGDAGYRRRIVRTFVVAGGLVAVRLAIGHH